MRANLAIGILFALAWAPAPVAADALSGGPAPEATFTDWYGEAPCHSMRDLRGRAVFLFFFGANSANSVAQVNRVNDFATRFGPRGLVVIGSCADGRAEIAGFCGRNAVTFPCADDPGGKVAATYGVADVPWGVLINPLGRVLWSGIPLRLLDDKPAEEATKGAIVRFTTPFPVVLKTLEPHLRRAEYAGVWKALDKPPGGVDPEFIEKLRADIKGFAADFRALAEAEAATGDVSLAIDDLTQMAAAFKGTPMAEELSAPVAGWKADPKLAPEIKATPLLAQARARALKFDYRGAAATYAQVMKQFADTRAAARAKVALDLIETDKLLKLLPTCKACRAIRAPCDEHR